MYWVVNESGHTVSMVIRPKCLEFPDSLGLSHGGQYHFNSEYNDCDKHSFFNKENQLDVGLIYYDNRYVIRIEDLPEDRNIRDKSDPYITIIQYNHTYTFTEADYLYAVEHGVDLGAEHEIKP